MALVLIGDTYQHAPTGELVVVLDLVYPRRSRGRARKLTRSVVVRPATNRTWKRYVVRAVDLVALPVAPSSGRLAIAATRKGQAA